MVIKVVKVNPDIPEAGVDRHSPRFIFVFRLPPEMASMTFLSLIDVVGSSFVVLVLEVEKYGIEKDCNCWEDKWGKTIYYASYII